MSKQPSQEITYTIKELKPILKEWAIQLMNGQGPMPPKKPTNFPDINAKDLDGSDTTVENLLKQFGAVPVKEEDLLKLIKGVKPPVTIKPEPEKATDQVFVELGLTKPRQIPEWLWKKEYIQDIFRWVIRNWCIIKAINRDNRDEQRIIYDPKRDKEAKEAKDNKPNQP